MIKTRKKEKFADVPIWLRAAIRRSPRLAVLGTELRVSQEQLFGAEARVQQRPGRSEPSPVPLSILRSTEAVRLVGRQGHAANGEAGEEGEGRAVFDGIDHLVDTEHFVNYWKQVNEKSRRN